MTQTTDGESAQTPVIEMKGVAVSSQAFPDQAVLENVNWTVQRGEYWVIGGMHGSGKTDLMSTAAGLLPPLSGEYHFLGHEMPIFEEHLVEERLRLALVFEGGQLLQNLTIQENIALPLRYHRPKTDAREVTEIMELTGLSHVADDFPATVSRSWQKRAGLARALTLRPGTPAGGRPVGRPGPPAQPLVGGFPSGNFDGRRLDEGQGGDAGGHDGRFAPVAEIRGAFRDFAGRAVHPAGAAE